MKKKPVNLNSQRMPSLIHPSVKSPMQAKVQPKKTETAAPSRQSARPNGRPKKRQPVNLEMKKPKPPLFRVRTFRDLD